ncbi:MAG: DUF434 domain-containing protein [Firmicutes bacterium]|nr:DUF434 domain-containing protein [Bacillota bacterium]
MSNKSTRRGFNPNDHKWFSHEAISVLKTAQEEIQWLLDRGYKPNVVIPFICNHYLLSARQRLALQRAVSSSFQNERRKHKMLPLETAREGCLYIDGFNLIITLEVALSKSPVILGNDGVMRDLAGLRGTYRLIRQTDKALELIKECFRELSVPEAWFYLDAPVSNSGRLRYKILEHADEWDIPVQVELVPDADYVLSKKDRIVTSDSTVLDKCISWFNLSRKIIGDYIKDAWIINFNPSKP